MQLLWDALLAAGVWIIRVQAFSKPAQTRVTLVSNRPDAVAEHRSRFRAFAMAAARWGEVPRRTEDG